jgi:putative pyruvate formate lyase activating enzyme
MRARRERLRIRVSDTGEIEVVDPGFDAIRLFRAIDPGYRVRTAALPGFSSPRFLRLRQSGTDLGPKDLECLTEADLWRIHDRLMRRFRQGRLASRKANGVEVNLLDLKIELAHRLLAHCTLCGHRCRVNRLEGQIGVCLSGAEALVAEHFVHIAEEPPINPSLLISLAGCGLRCRACQQAEILNPFDVGGYKLEPAFWPSLDWRGARSLSFAGGNPDESLHAVLVFLNAAPAGWKLPVVWNCNGFASLETMALLEGVVDAYVPDFKFGNDDCSKRLSTASNYFDTAHSAIGAMLKQDVPVLVRILALPGHSACCHRPCIDALAGMNTDLLSISILDQFRPVECLPGCDNPLDRRPSPEEITELRGYVRSRGLQLSV